MEKRKFQSYILYALGEVFLVVIGILIALQVNNWNQNNEKERIRQEYTMSMISDLKLDLEKILEYQTYIAEELKAMDTLGNYITDEVKDVLELRDIPFTANLGFISSLNNSTYEALISSGSIDLYPKELRDELIRHQGLQESYLQSYELNNRVFYETLNSYLQSAPVYNTPWIPEAIRKNLWENINYENFLTAFNALLLQRKFLLNIFQEKYIKLEESTRTMTTLLEKDLN